MLVSLVSAASSNLGQLVPCRVRSLTMCRTDRRFCGISKITVVVAAVAFACLSPIFADESVGKSGIEKNHFDPTVRAQDDLFRWVNGKWLNESKIPSDRPSDGAFVELRDRALKQVHAIIEEAGVAQGDADARKIADLFASFMDEGRAEQLGMKPIQAELDAIAAIKDKAGLI